jgi:phthiocerol/phenolphthiocerol synthesis type-I polyketide synthase E
MDDVSKRVQGLTEERRKLLEMLKAKGVVSAAESPGADRRENEPNGQEGLRLEYSTASDEIKENFRKFYNEVSKQLDATFVGSFSYFLNYGYVPDGSPESAVVRLPEKYINKNSVKLVLELVGDCDLTGRRLLDVGCGRGGTIYVLQQYFKPAAMTGIDLSANAIHFCKRTHKYPTVNFREGDAEHLLFEDASFDVVTNVESSHSYPNIRSFYMEVWRVLAPGGYFLYTDVMSRDKSDQGIGILRQLGFQVEVERDITNNVLLSCDEIASSRVQVFESGNDSGLVNNFLAAPGSQVYEEMKSRAWIYRILRLRKAAS